MLRSLASSLFWIDLKSGLNNMSKTNKRKSKNDPENIIKETLLDWLSKYEIKRTVSCPCKWKFNVIMPFLKATTDLVLFRGLSRELLKMVIFKSLGILVNFEFASCYCSLLLEKFRSIPVFKCLFSILIAFTSFEINRMLSQFS